MRARVRVYNLLLILYPSSFRREYGEEMRALFRRRRRDAAAPLGRGAVWPATILEVLSNAALAHWDILRSDLRYTVSDAGRTPGFALTAVA